MNIPQNGRNASKWFNKFSLQIGKSLPMVVINIVNKLKVNTFNHLNSADAHKNSL